MTDSPVKIQSFDAAKHRRSLFAYIPEVLRFPRLLHENRWMLWINTKRELVSRFHGSMLGAFWVLARPLFQFAVYFMVFGFWFERKSMGQDSPGADFALYLFSGVVMFTALTEAIGKCVTIVQSHASLVMKVKFPTQTLPIPPCAVAVVIYVIGSVVALGIGLATGVLGFSPALLAWPILIVAFFLYMVGFGMILGTLQVFVKDIQQLWMLTTMAWFFLSPVFWPPGFIHSKFQTMPWVIDTWFFVNPMHSMLLSTRLCLGAPPDLLSYPGYDYSVTLVGQLSTACLWGVVYFVVGYSLFTSRRMKFADLV